MGPGEIKKKRISNSKGTRNEAKKGAGVLGYGGVENDEEKKRSFTSTINLDAREVGLDTIRKIRKNGQ